jgi:hypothetical protein
MSLLKRTMANVASSTFADVAAVLALLLVSRGRLQKDLACTEPRNGSVLLEGIWNAQYCTVQYIVSVYGIDDIHNVLYLDEAEAAFVLPGHRPTAVYSYEHDFPVHRIILLLIVR